MRLGTSTFILYIFLLTICLHAGCLTEESASDSATAHTPDGEQIIQSPAMNPKGEENPPSSVISGRGKIIYQDLEGGFFGVIGDDGRKFLPASLPEKYKVDGMQVMYTFRPQKDTVSFMMWGEPVEIISIE